MVFSVIKEIMSQEKQTKAFADVVVQMYKILDQAVEVVIGSRTFECHQTALGIWSDYFRGSISSPLTTSNTIFIPESDYVSGEAFSVIHQYMYSGCFEMTSNLTFAVLRTAHYLQMSRIVDLCEDFIKEEVKKKTITLDLAVSLCKLEAQDLIGIRDLGDNVVAQKLFYPESKRRIMDLHVEILLRVLDNDNIRVRNEDHLFSLVLEWIQKDDSRYRFADDLLNQVKLGLVSTSALIKVKENSRLQPHLKKLDPILTDIIMSSLQASFKFTCQKRYKDYFQERSRPVIITEPTKQVLVCLLHGKKAMVWDKDQQWREGTLDLKDCKSNIVLGENVLYKISTSGWLMVREMNTGAWVNESQVPDYTRETFSSGSQPDPVLVFLRPRLYILTTRTSLIYDTKQKQWSVFDMDLSNWDFIDNAAACRSKDDPSMYVIVVSGGKGMLPWEDENVTENRIAYGNPKIGWTETMAKWNDLYREFATEEPYENPQRPVLVVDEVNETFFSLTEGSCIYRHSSLVQPSVSGSPAGWHEVSTKSICGVPLLCYKGKTYMRFLSALLPLPTGCEAPTAGDLQGNPSFMSMYHDVPIPKGIHHSKKLLLPVGLC